MQRSWLGSGETCLSEADTHNSEGDEDTPDHCSLIQIFCSVPPLKKKVLKTGLNVKPGPPGFPSACGGFDSRSQRSCFRALLVPKFPSEEEEGVKIQSKRVTDITYEQTIAVFSYRVSL